MKKVMVALVLVAACHRNITTASAPRSANDPQAGANEAAGALQTFLAAVHAQDLQAMGAAWGNEHGPVRDQQPRDDIEKRELIMLKCLRHDSYEIVTNAPSTAGMRVLTVQLKRRDATHSWNFTAIAGPGGHWYVRDFNMDLADAFCRG